MADKKRKTKGTPDQVDIHVGQRLRIRRSLLGFSQEKLAESVGVTFQQIQKYEKGTNRVSAGRLYQFCKVLDVPVNYFYEQYGDKGSSSMPAYGLSDTEQATLDHHDITQSKETIELLRVYYSIDDVSKRKDIVKFIKSMAETIGKTK